MGHRPIEIGCKPGKEVFHTSNTAFYRHYVIGRIKIIKPINPHEIKKILLIQLCPFGDVLIATSYLKALKEHYTQATIDFLVSKPYDIVLKNHPYIDAIIAGHKSDSSLAYVLDRMLLFFKIRKEKYDLVIDQQAGTGSATIVFFSGARYRLGWDNAKGRRHYNLIATKEDAPQYQATRHFAMIKPLGIPEQPYAFYFSITSESHAYVASWLAANKLTTGSFICFSPASPVSKKGWSIKRYAELALLIHTKLKLPVVIVYAPSELPIAEAVVALSKNKALLSPPTTYNQIAAMLTACRLLVCNDGGNNHLSVATQTDTIALFGHTPATVWSPQSAFPNHRHVCIDKTSWTAEDTAENYFGITVSMVFTEIEKLLGA